MRLTILGLAFFLAACGTGEGNCPSLPGGGRYCLQPGPWPVFSGEQQATVSYGDKVLHLIARLDAGPGGLQFAGLTPLGQTLIRVSWENGRLRTELPPALAGRLDGSLFAVLLQMATWPAEQVRAGLGPGLELAETPGRRVVRHHDQDLLIISWEGENLPYQRLSFDAPVAGLAIEARTLDGGEGE